MLFFTSTSFQKGSWTVILTLESQYSGLHPWQKLPEGSRLDKLAADIEAGAVKVAAPVGGGGSVPGEKRTHHNDGVVAPENAHHRDGITDVRQDEHHGLHDEKEAVGRERGTVV